MAVYYAGFIPRNDVYAVLFPDLPGCISQGYDLEEAFSMAVEALARHLECMADNCDAIPEPSSKSEALARLREQMAELPEGTELHPVQSPNLGAQIKKITVLFSQCKLNMIDRKAKAAGMSRSGFLAAAASAFESPPYA